MESRTSTSSQSCKTNTTTTTASLHILVVDDDTTCLAVAAALLRTWKYEVVTSKHPMDALSMLRVKRGAFDLVVTDIHMPDMNGFELQKQVEEEFKLPVAMMSADNKESVVLKGLTSGAAFFMAKPVNVEEIKNIWQYVATNKKCKSDDEDDPPLKSGQELTKSNISEKTSTHHEDIDTASSVNEEKRIKRECKRKALRKGGGLGKDYSTPKKTKVVWTNALHSQFLEAVRKIGIDKAVPKKILELMKVPGLTRENIASHLQKYRMFLRRVSDASNCIEQQCLRTSFQQGFIGNLPIVNAPLINSTLLQRQEPSTNSSIPQFGNANESHLVSSNPAVSQHLPLFININPNSQANCLNLQRGTPNNIRAILNQDSQSTAILGHLKATTMGMYCPTNVQGMEGNSRLPKNFGTATDFRCNFVGFQMMSNGELVGPNCSRTIVNDDVPSNGLISGSSCFINMVQNGDMANLVQEVFPFPYMGFETSGFSAHFANVDPQANSMLFQLPLQQLQHQQINIHGNNDGGEVPGSVHCTYSSTFGSNAYLPHLCDEGGDLNDVLRKQVNHHSPNVDQNGEEALNPTLPNSSYYIEEIPPRNESRSLGLHGDDYYRWLDQHVNQGGDEELMNLVFGAGRA